jgi:hypothetical protein
MLLLRLVEFLTGLTLFMMINSLSIRSARQCTTRVVISYNLDIEIR